MINISRGEKSFVSFSNELVIVNVLVWITDYGDVATSKGNSLFICMSH